MKLGVHCANLTWPGGPEALGTTLAGVARAADEAWLTTMQSSADLGITQVWVSPDAADPVGWTELMCETVLPRLADIGA